jgi:putative DNA primase/helicase
LHTIFDGSEDLIAFIQRAIGYSLTGVVAEQALFFLHGHGQNGKSTFCEVFAALLGAHFQKAPASLLMTKDGARLGGASPHIARLFRARMVVAAEISQDHRLNEAQVKDLTGGDTIAARHLFQGYFEFRPTHKLWLYGNHRPLIRGIDEGIWRRIHLIPFTVQIPREEQDPFFLRDRLLPELPGILAWAVQGCLAWQQDRLGVPREVREATDAYRAHMDHFHRFLDDCCVMAPHLSSAVKDLYTAYMTWCDETREETMGKGAFSTALEDRGFQKHKSGKDGRFRRGLALASGGLLHAMSPTDSSGADF